MFTFFIEPLHSRVGPVRRVEDLDISASKEGFQFNAVKGGRVGELHSVRLSKLTVAVSEIGENGWDFETFRF